MLICFSVFVFRNDLFVVCVVSCVVTVGWAVDSDPVVCFLHFIVNFWILIDVLVFLVYVFVPFVNLANMLGPYDVHENII